MINHHKLIALDYYKQKELDTDPKVIQQIEFVEQLKKNWRCERWSNTIYVCFNSFRKN